MVERLRRSPGAIEAALAELGIEAALELNGLAYFDQAVEERIDKLLRRREAERILGRKIREE
jgi:hypothetical protein